MLHRITLLYTNGKTTYHFTSPNTIIIFAIWPLYFNITYYILKEIKEIKDVFVLQSKNRGFILDQI